MQLYNTLQDYNKCEPIIIDSKDLLEGLEWYVILNDLSIYILQFKSRLLDWIIVKIGSRERKSKIEIGTIRNNNNGFKFFDELYTR